MNAAPSGAAGEASGLLNTARTIGQSLSVALAGTVFTGLGGAAAGRALIGAGTRIATAADIEALQRRFLGGFEGALMTARSRPRWSISLVLALVLGWRVVAGDRREDQQENSSHLIHVVTSYFLGRPRRARDACSLSRGVLSLRNSGPVSRAARIT